ncbi:hypothetical protein COW46_01705 [Candidatus Gracilibacteria bacterium CG17_big_fil_post_rev_8_21_14_2_50_48_13]|nr:MAG: hypothetical protein COW46_01705 [Candidatus Gracilibacteria bacterium CG17_big_fil_post_rev_8_21_14_2_50_48_13]
MAKRPSPRVLASLFDAASHHGPAVPKELLLAWSASTREEDVAHALLAEYKTLGTCILGDASGLSKLSQTLPLVEVLSLLHRPKTMIASLGEKYGGVPVSSWTADNSGMWFDAAVHPKEVYTYAQNLLASFEHFPFQMSFAFHAGEFYRVGNALVGPMFHALEEVAENQVPAGCLWATEATIPFLGTQGSPMDSSTLSMRQLPVAGTPEMTFAEAHAPYPHAFSSAFFSMLDVYARSKDVEKDALRSSMEADVRREGHILFFAYALPKQQSLAGVLNAQELDTYLVSSVRMAKRSVGARLIKVGGGIGIVMAATLEGALAEAETLGVVFAEAEVAVAMGIDRGEFFLFEQEDGDVDVAGSPVNIASKLSEDCGKPGIVYVSEAAGSVMARTTRPIHVSGITIVAQEHALARV